MTKLSSNPNTEEGALLMPSVSAGSPALGGTGPCPWSLCSVFSRDSILCWGTEGMVTGCTELGREGRGIRKLLSGVPRTPPHLSPELHLSS